MVKIEEEEEAEFEDAIGEQDDLGQVVDVPLCALSGALAERTIVIKGILNDRKMVIFIDAGSSYSYNSSQLVRELALKFVLVYPLSATIADSRTVASKFVVPKVK